MATLSLPERMLPQVVHRFDRCATLGCYTAWKRARVGLVRILAPALMLLLSVTVATGQTPRLKNIFLCNGEDRTTPDPQIKGCTALIDAGGENLKTLASAYNNRGDAYIAKGEYDLAINDFDQSIKLNADSARTFNNRGVAYKKRANTNAQCKILTRQSNSIRCPPAPSPIAPEFMNRKASTSARRKTTTRQSGLRHRWIQRGKDVVGIAPSSANWTKPCRIAMRRYG